MTEWLKFFSTEGLLSVAEAFGGRADLWWPLALGDLALGASLLFVAVSCFFLYHRIRVRASGLLLLLASLLALLGATHLVSAWLLWTPVFWLSSLLKIVTAGTAVVAALWIAQVWPQIVEFAVTVRRFESYNSRIERRHSRALFTDKGFEKLLNRSVFLPTALALVLIAVFTSQITYLVYVKGEVAEATQRISYMHALQRNFVDAESALRGYLLTGKAEYLQPLESATSRTPRMLNDLMVLNKEHALVHANLQKLASNFIEWVDIANPLIERRRKGIPYRNSNVETYHRELMDQSRALFSETIRLTVRERDVYSDDADQVTHLFILVSVSLAGLIGLGLALWSRKQITSLSGNYAQALETARELNAHLEQRVSERTRELFEANSRLAAANSELEAFSYSVSHDLRGPLRGIDGFSQILIEDETGRLSPESQRHIGFIRDGVRKMGQLIDDLLNLSRISKADLQAEKTDAAGVAREVLADLREAHPNRKVEYFADAEIPVRADPALLKILLQNLLGNAWKFTGRIEHARIEVRGIADVGATGFKVIDNGAGFDMNFQAKLFQAFQRLHSAKEFEGTGIGLALCRRIVQRHGGRIWAEGQLGQGATIQVLFPTSPENHVRPGLPKSEIPPETHA
ncbi:MAG: CHASE3 domain-containing protein [Bdellovibrionaceae bacterium]|nr:CHASE3 domain-containing protein [Pseudobdellovibrionaceae bacterium]